MVETVTRENRNFELCPPGVIEMRPVINSNTGEADALWRTEDCRRDRWHYWDNPCNCSVLRFKQPRAAYEAMGFALQRAKLTTGTWCRDGRAIESMARNFREQLRCHAWARAARGPQMLQPDLYFRGTPIWWDDLEHGEGFWTVGFGHSVHS
jgi:hypothetical protein